MRIASIVMTLSGLLAMPAFAQSSSAVDAVRAPFQACGAIQDKDQRVACFDRALSESDATTAKARAADRAAEAKRKTEDFGLNSQPKPEKIKRVKAAKVEAPVEPEAVQLTVANASENGIGRWTIVSTNGATWRQTETVANFNGPRQGDTMTVRKATMGSYLLRVGKQPITRVERLR